MDVFGKELNLEMDYKNKIRLIYLFTIIIIIIMFIFMVVNPSKKLYDTRNELKVEQANLVQVEEKLVATEKRHEDVVAEFKRQEERYGLLKEQFESAAHNNNATFKREIQDVMDYFGIKLSRIGAPEIAPQKPKNNQSTGVEGDKGKEPVSKDDEFKYEKRYFAYQVNGLSAEMATFFYYLENSKRLITLKDGVTNISRGEEDSLNGTFKIGTYFFEEGDKND